MSLEFLLISFTLFLAVAVAVPLSTRFGLGAVLGYLIAGVILGPGLQFAGVDIEAIRHFSEFGVVMMLFIIGLEMNPKAIWDMRTHIFLLGSLQVILTSLLISIILIIFSFPITLALAIGLIFALSSTAIVSQTLREKSLMTSKGGRASFSVLLLQDMAIIPLLALLPLLATPEFNLTWLDSHLPQIAENITDIHAAETISLVQDLSSFEQAFWTIVAIIFVIFVGNFLTTPIFNFVASARTQELLITTALMFILGIALIMMFVGLSPALGTFLAGLVMASSPYRHEIQSNINPLKSIFLGIFFITIGASINFTLLGTYPILILCITFSLIFIKALVLYILGGLFRLREGQRWLFTLGLAQAGEFGLVLIAFSLQQNILPAPIADLSMLVIALSMLLTPLLFVLYDKIVMPKYTRQEIVEEEDLLPQTEEIIIVGHGRFGSTVNRALHATGHRAVIMENNVTQLKTLRKLGIRALYGDARRSELLESAGIHHAKLLIIAVHEQKAITEIAQLVIHKYPHVHIVARAVDQIHTLELMKTGHVDIVRENYHGSLLAAQYALEALGYDKTTAHTIVDTMEEVDQLFMSEMANLDDLESLQPSSSDFFTKLKSLREKWEDELHKRLEHIL